MFELNGTIAIFVLSFLVFIYLLNKIMLKPVGRVLEKRVQLIKSDLDEAGKAKSSAEKALAEYEQHLHEVRHKARTIIDEAVSQADTQSATQLEKVRAQGRQRVDAARDEIAGERTALMEALAGAEVSLVNEIGSKVFGQPVSLSLDPARVRRALEEAS